LQWILKAKPITIDEVTLPLIPSTICKNASTLRVQQHNDKLAKETISTQDANKSATWMLDTNDKKADFQSIVKTNCKHLSANPQKKLLQLLINELFFDGTLGDWKN
jgi:hypothetical protein